MPTWFYLAVHPEARLSANDQIVDKRSISGASVVSFHGTRGRIRGSG
jgi:hypothetical protein